VEHPEITCPEDIIVDELAVVDLQEPAPDISDNSGPVTWNSDWPEDNDFPIGETTIVTYTATDDAGLSTSCNFSVTVLGKTISVDHGSKRYVFHKWCVTSNLNSHVPNPVIVNCVLD